MNKADINIIAV